MASAAHSNGAKFWISTSICLLFSKVLQRQMQSMNKWCGQTLCCRCWSRWQSFSLLWRRFGKKRKSQRSGWERMRWRSHPHPRLLLGIDNLPAYASFRYYHQVFFSNETDTETAEELGLDKYCVILFTYLHVGVSSTSVECDEASGIVQSRICGSMDTGLHGYKKKTVKSHSFIKGD